MPNISSDSSDNEVKSNSWEEESSESSDEQELEIEDSDNNKRKKTEERVSSSSSGSSSSGDETNKEFQEKKFNEEKQEVRRSDRPKQLDAKKLNDAGSSGESESSNDGSRKKKSDNWIPTLSDSESEESDDDDSDSSYDVPQRKKKRVPDRKPVQRTKPQQRRKQLESDSDSDSDYGKRRSKKKGLSSKKQVSRGTTSNVRSYKEDSEGATDSDDIIEPDETTAPVEPQEEFETIEKVLRHRQGLPGDTGANTTIYAVREEKPSAAGDEANTETELQFCIKWKGWSNMHNTWESQVSLKREKCAGMKKLENYMKRMDEIDAWKQRALPEDVDYFECQQEMNEDIQKHNQQVERIIAHKENTDSPSHHPDYLCKWVGLPYSDTTWEDGNLTARFFQSHIDEYLEREQADTIPNKNAKVLRQRPKFNAFKTQPDFLGSETLQLRDYQVDGINWLVHAWTREVSCILSDEMGLGKTIQTISFLSYLFHKYRLYGPYLVVVPLSTMDAWAREFKLWAPALNIIVYIGDVNSRQKIQEFEWCNAKTRKLKFNVLLTTYEMLLRDKDLLGSIYWATLMVDEAHRLKNDDSLLYRVLIDFRTNYRLLITGTPLQNSLKELWSLMHFIMPKQFDSWEDFESEYSIQDKDGLQKLHRDLEPYLLRRVKKDVEKSLPAKVEQILRVEMSQIQKQYYKLILTRNVTELCKELKGKFSGLLNIIVELKKCCNHAFLIKPLEPAENDPNVLEAVIKGSGKMILLDKLMCRLKATGHRVLIFSQMVRMLDVIADYLYLKRFQFQRLDGSVRGDQRKRALDHFNAEGSQDFCFLLSTRAGGLGINLATADTVIIFDSDWNPQNDLQAMARAHRIGQKNKVNIYRFVTKSTIEEDIIERAKKKMVLDHLIIQRMDTTGRRILSKTNTASSSSVPFNKEELSNILKFGAGELFKDHDTEADQKLQAMDIDEILERAETQDTREHDNGVGEELLSQFKVVNYAAFDEEAIEKPAAAPTPMQKLWEEIIPEEDRKKMEEELEAEKKQQQVLKPRSRKTVQKMNVGVPDEKPTKKPSSRTVSKANDAQSNRKIKSKAFVDTDTSSDESDSTTTAALPEDEKPKKSAAAKKKSVVQQENVKGFTDAEIRRFVKSFKKFARPMSRLDTIAEDAELTDKSSAELREFGELLKKNCEEAVKEYQEKLQQDETFDGRKNGATLKLSGVTINAPSILKSEIDLEPLFLCLPSEPTQQKTYRLTVPTRSVHWGKTWGVIEDSMLLVGMLKYGVGSWDAIKNDPALTLSNKILPVGDGKPQGKHLLSRAEYLLKLLKQQTNNNEKTKKNKKKSSKPNASATVADEKPAEKKKKADNKSPTIEVHSTIEANVVVEEINDMNDEIFKKCKERMRPERKCLQLLHTPDNSLTPEEQVQTTKKCLLKIGDHVERCCQATPEQQDLRSKLWSFVAKFTELGSSKLYKLYRTACKKRDHEKNVTAHHEKHVTTSHENKSLSPNRQQLDKRKASGLQKSSSRSMKIPHKDKRSHHASSSKAWEGKDEKRQTTATSRDVENNDSRNNAATQMTYREWKEKQKEKELNRPLKQDKLRKQYPSGFDPRSRPRYHRDIPDAVKSPSSSRSPLNYSGDNRQYRGDSRPYSGDNRKRHRTSSNNSAESSGSMAKKYHPNPREERS